MHLKEQEEKLQKLKQYFKNRDDIVMAFVFGSQASGRAHQGSDWDIAVYFKPEVASMEWEETGREYSQEDKVWGDCIDLLQTDNVDLLVLNRAPASIADTAIRGVPLVIKNHGIWLRFMLIITREAEDYRDFVHDFYTISQRSASLTKEDRENLERGIDFFENQLSLYPVYRTFTKDDYEGDLRKRNEVERWIENIMNASIDIAKIILASEKQLIPDTYRSTLERAIRLLILEPNLAQKFEQWIKLRNVLAHEYLDIKWKRISSFISDSEPYVRQFVDAAKRFLESDIQ